MPKWNTLLICFTNYIKHFIISGMKLPVFHIIRVNDLIFSKDFNVDKYMLNHYLYI